MAYTNRYDYDIFISYCHDDNKEPSGRKGWVTEFRDYLENWLVMKRGLKELRISMDDKLCGNTVFDKAIEDRISNTALFLVIHSHNYHASEYCRKELQWFFDHNTSRPEGLMVGEESRLFNVLTNNINYTKWPAPLSQAGGPSSGFVLHDAEGGEDFGYPTSPRAPQFDTQLRKLVEAIVKTLDAFPKDAVSVQATKETAPRISLFIADVPDTLQSFRTRLINEVGGSATILSKLPPPYPVEDHNRRLQEVLQQADISIHLLDQWSGRMVDGAEQQTYPRLQADTAVSCQTAAMIWVPADLKMEAIDDKEHSLWLTNLEKGERREARFQFIRSSEQALIDQVLQSIAGLEQENLSGVTGPGRFLIDTHQKDQRYAFELAVLLDKKNIEFELTREYTDDPVKSLTNFEQAVRKVQNLIFMFGRVAPNWLIGRIQAALKLAFDPHQQEMLLTNIWVLLLPGSPGEQAIPLMERRNISTLDNTQSEAIDQRILSRLLGGSEGEKQK
ncbi:MAG: toll/interleukin-1 receptor domain-containing protein [Proteobacteria bacterium]|nr:toll/interleukin-1 receptor domain-containing protein [Pseudomonadota bacterium]MBU4296754.1 toll/interleukin-1 receptor domain-containing protein [Pseudomonadota bacterium]MCG2745932.1 toll/interleukin-1 receptor domain-containing protein [Desulfobulbaceae bacterium]